MDIFIRYFYGFFLFLLVFGRRKFWVRSVLVLFERVFCGCFVDFVGSVVVMGVVVYFVGMMGVGV